jgi:hypothetical protein
MDQQVQKASRGVRSAERPSGNSIRSNAEASAGEAASRRTLIHEGAGSDKFGTYRRNFKRNWPKSQRRSSTPQR